MAAAAAVVVNDEEEEEEQSAEKAVDPEDGPPTAVVVEVEAGLILKSAGTLSSCLHENWLLWTPSISLKDAGRVLRKAGGGVLLGNRLRPVSREFLGERARRSFALIPLLIEPPAFHFHAIFVIPSFCKKEVL